MTLTWRTVAPRRLPWPGRSRRPSPEPVELSALRYGFLPARFRHQGEIHRVARVEQIWEQRGSRTRADRRYFAVSCADARRCTLVQELRAGTWHVVW